MNSCLRFGQAVFKRCVPPSANSHILPLRCVSTPVFGSVLSTACKQPPRQQARQLAAACRRYASESRTSFAAGGAAFVRTVASKAAPTRSGPVRSGSVVPMSIFGLDGGTLGYSLLLSGIVCLGMNTVGYIITAITKTHKITDLTGCGTFAISAWATHIANAHFAGTSVFEYKRPLFLTIGVTFWSVRLAGYLFYRILQTNKDKRLEKFYPEGDEKWLVGPSHFPINLAFFWVIQATWAFAVLLPVTVAQAVAPRAPMGAWGWIGFALFMSAFAFEAVADFQKNAFKNKPGNGGEFMRTGLFTLCQFPNYFGEMTVWIVMCLWAGLPDVLPKHPWIIISPVFITALLLFVSGIPATKEQQDKRYGDRQDYQEYRANTPVFFPLPWRKVIPGQRRPPSQAPINSEHTESSDTHSQ